MSMAVDGLISNLDTTALINSLISLEAIPQGLLKAKVSDTQAMVTALQGLNTQIASLGELAQKTAAPAALDLYTSTSSSSQVKVTASAGAGVGSLELVVDQVAQSQVSVSGAVSAWPDTSITITDATGTPQTITAASTSLDDMVSAINAADAGVSAVKVAAGTDPGTGAALYRLQFTGTETGAAGEFTISGTTPLITDVRNAQDAQVTLWKDTPAAQVVTSSTNTFSNLLPGVAVTVSAKSVDPVVLTVARDNTQISKIASDFVNGINGVLAQISTKSMVTNSTGTTGEATVSGSVFTGDSTIRGVAQKILSAASMPVDGISPSEIGISITKGGEIEFDAEKFAAALAADPAKVGSIVEELATRVASASVEASDKYDGVITSKITGQESLVENLSGQITEWDRRLEARRATLERTYAALEVQLAGINAQGAWLASQLPATSSGSTN